MATLLLQAAGTAIGTFLGGPVGAMVGRSVGGLLGSAIDARLLGGLTQSAAKMPRLLTMNGISSVEGTPIPRLYGKARVGGQVIWATRFLEVTTHSQVSGGKSTGPRATTYSYYANFAVGLCEGPIAFVRRVWADGKELDLTLLNVRVYTGTETQTPDPLIIAKEGSAPAYAGLAYVVFEMLPLTYFGNRVPQLTFEVVRPVAGLGAMVQAVDIIPGATEFGYSPLAFTNSWGAGSTSSVNRHQLTHVSDWTASIDALQALCPNLKSVALVVAWFGDDLRADHCLITPRVVDTSQIILEGDWQVAGLARPSATPVSLYLGNPAYGGTPSDASVIAALEDLRARGLRVTFYPFVMMDIPTGNALPDPWGAAAQAAYPWRGRISCTPAPGLAGTVDGTPAAATQISRFFGSVNPSAGEWSYRNFILYYAQLCATAGGVDAFLVGSELVGLTRVRSASGVYPAANALAQLCADAKAVLGAATKVSYAADWSEYGAHVLQNGAEIRFPLDVVWASPHVDFIGIDAYWPLSDWRDGTAHLDAQIARSVHDPDYLAGNMNAGECFDFYYASASDRFAQIRTPITDGAYNKPWLYRAKDLVGYWSNPHIERVGGVELTAATGFVPMSKPIWLMEAGCPAVDRGTNAPNVFPDPKSTQNNLPPFSRGGRDDLIQARALRAFICHFDPSQPGFHDANNPVSSLYGARMVDASRIHLWAWDARPFPAFPDQSGVWADAVNWETGHWLNGRLEGVDLADLVTALLGESPGLVSKIMPPALDGFLDGYVLDRTLTTRGAVEPLAALYGFDVLISAGWVRCLGRTNAAQLALTAADFVPDKDGKLLKLTRAEDASLPHELALTFSDSERYYRSATALSRRLSGFTLRNLQAELAVVMRQGEAQRLADIWLQDLWVARETAEFTLRPSLQALEVGDAVTLAVGGANRLFRIDKITDGLARQVVARAVEPDVYDRQARDGLRPMLASPPIPGPPQVVVLDLAIAREDPTNLQYMAISATPWPGTVSIWRAVGAASYNLWAQTSQCATIGLTLTDFQPGPAGRFDNASSLTLKIGAGTLSSPGDAQMLAGAANMAIQGSDSTWEIFGFSNAVLVGPQTYVLSRFIRGLGGQEALCQRSVPKGATVVLLNDALVPIANGTAALGISSQYRVGPASRDYNDNSYVSLGATPGKLPYLPYAPVQATALRTGAGVAIAFKRRGRRDADAWEPMEIPLGEASEAYAVAIFRAGQIVRTLLVNTPAALYAASDELADFGAPQSAMDVEITQISTIVGPGFGLRMMLTIT
ncbi:MAG: glycoside hydrolase TIM-barrel-like domain-containing protein [Hyphomicrobiales bacterium]|nr:glycoside hydrolase TIM-barrel-like domain-containing protein [Hyphomicrobiales bacterium]MDE2113797.1 glycoside hydrolase/phage tail family protein [Hyphomicrobiales bacterium]